jgi:membrane fusion protein (multidrug efflux system)
MADTVLKFSPAASSLVPRRRSSLAQLARKNLRLILLVILPLIAVVIGLGFYLSGGRYISTDNSYVGAPKVLITPDISGRVTSSAVTEGQHVNVGDVLVEIDREPFRLALTQAQSKLATVRTDFANQKNNVRSLATLVDLAQKNVELKQRDVDRKASLVASRSGSQVDLDNANAALVTAQLQHQYAMQQQEGALNQLLGNPDLPIEQYPAYMQAQAALEQAQRDLDHTTLKAPIAGIATQVDNIQPGRFVAAGTAVLSVINDGAPWVDANPKETDVTYLRVGQPVTIDVDAFPEHTFHGTVASLSPGTGSQFAILPPQNASGNWVKVVQRVPVRVAFNKDEDTHNLRAGMSANVEIDTGRRRTLFGHASAAQDATP